ncbi:uncharacterized protein ISCGN_005810 [Ixodes scapularis]
MPQDCAFGNCKNVAKRGSGCRFFCFPSERLQRKRRKLWIAAVTAVNRTNEDGTPWLPHSNSRVCSAHFITGEPSRCVTHPDYVPSILNIPVAGARDHGPSGVPALQDCDHSHSSSPETDWSRDEEMHAAAGPSGMPAVQDCDPSHFPSRETNWSREEERHAAAGPGGVPVLQDCDHSHSPSAETDWSWDAERHAAAGETDALEPSTRALRERVVYLERQLAAAQATLAVSEVDAAVWRDKYHLLKARTLNIANHLLQPFEYFETI